MKGKTSKSGLLLASLLVLLPALQGCDGNEKFAKLSDYELAEEHGKCLDKKPTAPGAKIICDNYAKECDRRKKALGTFVCRTH